MSIFHSSRLLRLLASSVLLALFVFASALISGCGDNESTSFAPESNENAGEENVPEIYQGWGGDPYDGLGGIDIGDIQPQGKPIIEF